MMLEELLEVAIGLIFAWLVLSVATMQVQEWLNNFIFNWRADFLKIAVSRLLNDPAMTAQLYAHPLIKGLTKQHTQPTYIPSDKFVLALFDVIATAGTEASLIQRELTRVQDSLRTIPNKKDRALAEAQLKALISIARRAASTPAGTELAREGVEVLQREVLEYAERYPTLKPILHDAIKQATKNQADIATLLEQQFKPVEDGASTRTIDNVYQGIIALSVINPDLKQSLSSLLIGVTDKAQSGEMALANARDKVEGWFNNSMDQLSSWYKKHSQKWAFFIGVGLAIFLNVDSLTLANSLWREPTLRAALVAQAENFEMPPADPADPNAAMAQFRSQFDGLNIPVGWILAPTSPDYCDFNYSDGAIGGVGLYANCYQLVNAPAFDDVNGWLMKILGLFISGAAAAQGAPFWFDILRRALSFRSGGDEKKK